MRCKKCGRELNGASSCPMCGTAVEPTVANGDVRAFIDNDPLYKLMSFATYVIRVLFFYLFIKEIYDYSIMGFYEVFHALSYALKYLPILILNLLLSLARSIYLTVKFKASPNIIHRMLAFTCEGNNGSATVDGKIGDVWQSALFISGRRGIIAVLAHKGLTVLRIILFSAILPAILDRIGYFFSDLEGVRLYDIITSGFVFSVAMLIAVSIIEAKLKTKRIILQESIRTNPGAVSVSPSSPTPAPQTTSARQGSQRYTEEDLKMIFGEDYDPAELENLKGDAPEPKPTPVEEPINPSHSQASGNSSSAYSSSAYSSSAYSSSAYSSSTYTPEQNTPALPMGWYKFLVNFVLLLYPFAEGYTAVYSLMLSDAYDATLGYDYVYAAIPTYSALFAAMLAILSIIVRTRLKKFKKGAPTLLTVFLVLNAASGIMSSVATALIFGAVSFMTTVFYQIVFAVVMIVINTIYFRNRKHLFKN